MVPVSDTTQALNLGPAAGGGDEDVPDVLLPQAAASTASKLNAATAGTVCRTDYLLFRGGLCRLVRGGLSPPARVVGSPLRPERGRADRSHRPALGCPQVRPGRVPGERRRAGSGLAVAKSKPGRGPAAGRPGRSGAC